MQSHFMQAQPGGMPDNPFPEPVRPPTPAENPSRDPLNIPQTDPDMIDPGLSEPVGIPGIFPTDVPPLAEPPGVM